MENTTKGMSYANSIIISTVVVFLFAAVAFGIAVYLLSERDQNKDNGDNGGGGEGSGKSGFSASLENSNSVDYDSGDKPLTNWIVSTVANYNPENFEASTGIYTVQSQGNYNINFIVGMGEDTGTSQFSVVLQKLDGSIEIIGTIDIPSMSTDTMCFSVEVPLQPQERLFVTGALPTAGGIKSYITTLETPEDYYDGLLLQPRALLAHTHDVVSGPEFICKNIPASDHQYMVSYPIQNGADLDPSISSMSGFVFNNGENILAVNDGTGYEFNKIYTSTEGGGSGSGATFRVLSFSGDPADNQPGIIQIVDSGKLYSIGLALQIQNPAGTNINLPPTESLQTPNMIVQGIEDGQTAAVSVYANFSGPSSDSILEFTPASLPLTNHYQGGMVSADVISTSGTGTGAKLFLQYEDGNPKIQAIYLQDGGDDYAVGDDAHIVYTDQDGVSQNLDIDIDAISRENVCAPRWISVLPRSSKVMWDLVSTGSTSGSVDEVRVTRSGYNYTTGSKTTTVVTGTGTSLEVEGGDGSFQGGDTIVDLDVTAAGSGYKVGDTFSVDGNTASATLGDTLAATAEVTLLTQGKALFYDDPPAEMYLAELSDPYHHISVGDCFTYSTPTNVLGKVVTVTETLPLMSKVATATLTITQL